MFVGGQVCIVFVLTRVAFAAEIAMEAGKSIAGGGGERRWVCEVRWWHVGGGQDVRKRKRLRLQTGSSGYFVI